MRKITGLYQSYLKEQQKEFQDYYAAVKSSFFSVCIAKIVNQVYNKNG